MNQKALIQNRWLYRVLRVVAGIMTTFVGLMILLTAGTALAGDTDMLIDFIDMEKKAPALDMVDHVAIVFTSGFAIITFWLLFRSINQFLKHAERGELFLDSTANALSRMGRAMILLYLVFLCFDVLLPMLIAPRAMIENGIDFIIYMIDPNVLTLLIGTVLIALAGALREGREIQDELRQIV